MRPVIHILRERVAAAVGSAFDLDPSSVDPLVRKSQDARFGDYQSNCAMGLAKRLGVKPQDAAQRIQESLDIDDVCDDVTIAGPGFINLRLSPGFVANHLAGIESPAPGEQDRLGVAVTDDPVTVVIDMSSPNLAKEMHVGHVRSTVIGDCIARVLEFTGHDVHRVNHIGDWGTQFGMLLAYLRRTQPGVLDNPSDLVLDDLEKFYVQAKTLYDSDESFAAESRQTVVEFQSQEPSVMAVWRAFCDESLRHCHAIYDRMDIKLEDRGESFYRDMLGDIVKMFKDKGLATQSKGALCVFLDGFTTRDGNPLPMMIQKSDGGYNYASTDLAAIYHRIYTLGGKQLIYLVGIAQRQHFEMLFAAVRKIGWADDSISLEHIGFGNLLGSDGKPFKTRTGGTVKLKDLLDEAVRRARAIVERGSSGDGARCAFDQATIDDIAGAVGIGAIKYFDLSHSLAGDYKFDWDTMLSMEGNTAPYMLYAYARIRSIGRKAGVDFGSLSSDAEIVLEHESELRLAKILLRFAETVEVVADERRPNALTDYLYELSKGFSVFYDRRHGVRVIDAPSEALRASRLRLCDLTARTLKLGLGLLGIKTVERM